MEEERIEVVRKWPKPKLVRNIQVFLGFANFYQQFIQEFSKIAAPFTSILKTTMSWQMLAANKMHGARVLVTNKIGDVEGGDRSERMKSKIGRSKS